MAVTKLEQSARLKRNEEKWSTALMDAGWTVFPSIILEKQQALGLDAIDVNILMQLARHWWRSDNPPHPSKRAIAQCIGVDPSTVRKHIKRMENDGFIRREPRYSTKLGGGQIQNAYHFNGLIETAKPFAKEFVALREKQRGENAARTRRKKPARENPNLAVVPPPEKRK
jgi:predicted transcriptional regulator